MRVNGVNLYQQNGNMNKAQKPPVFGAELVFRDELMEIMAKRLSKSEFKLSLSDAKKQILESYQECQKLFRENTEGIKGELCEYYIKDGEDINLMYHFYPDKLNEQAYYLDSRKYPITTNLNLLIKRLTINNETRKNLAWEFVEKANNIFNVNLGLKAENPFYNLICKKRGITPPSSNPEIEPLRLCWG